MMNNERKRPEPPPPFALRRCLRMLSAAGTRIQKGLIRYLYIVVDFSRAAAETDFRPSKMVVMAKHVKAFIREFFDQKLVWSLLTDLGGSPESHIKALMVKLESSGDSTLQNTLELAVSWRPFRNARKGCPFMQVHLKDLILEHASLPPAIAEFLIANLIKMGFPQRAGEGSMAICWCHKEVKIGACYTCPRCKARVCELPTECTICGLTLVSSPHLARSYHHLFPNCSI